MPMHRHDMTVCITRNTEAPQAYNCLDVHVAVSFLLEEDAYSRLHCTERCASVILVLAIRGRAECGKSKPEPPDSPLKMSFEDIIDLFACAKPRCM